MNFPFFPSPNFTPGRKKKIKAVIIHRSCGDLNKTIERCFDLNSFESFHFIIPRRGRVIQLVKCQDTAWHCGWITNPEAPEYLKPNPNLCSVGIVLEDQGEKESFWTKNQKEALQELLHFLQKTLEIELSPRFTMGHSSVDPKRNPDDPGFYLNWGDLLGEKSFLKKEVPFKSWTPNEFIVQEITRKLFRGILGRNPSPSELDYYKHSRLDISQISQRLIKTEEFLEKIKNFKG